MYHGRDEADRGRAEGVVCRDSDLQEPAAFCIRRENGDFVSGRWSLTKNRSVEGGKKGLQRGSGRTRRAPPRGERSPVVPSYPFPIPRPLITASQANKFSSLTGPSLSIPLSSFRSARQTSSSLMSRLTAPRPSEDDFDFFLSTPLLAAAPAGFDVDSGRFWIRHDILFSLFFCQKRGVDG